MKMPVLPVTNAMIPRPSEEITGAFLGGWVKKTLSAAGPRGMALVLPYRQDTGLYPVGAVVLVEDVWEQKVLVSPLFTVGQALFAQMSGKAKGRAGGFDVVNGTLFATGVETVDLGQLRPTYPAIDGAGWIAVDGATEARSARDIRVSVSGSSHAGEPVALHADLGGVVGPQIAHTVEHAIIRSLASYAIVTPKTLRESLRAESEDLKSSLEAGYRLRMPEFFGMTSTGMCGNPLTGLAQFYMAGELQRNLERGQSLPESVRSARLRALSMVTGDLDLSTEPSSRVLQGLRRGMVHDDSPLSSATLKEILQRFPLSPV